MVYPLYIYPLGEAIGVEAALNLIQSYFDVPLKI